jgi:putative hydrolase of the HAD superfamily
MLVEALGKVLSGDDPESATRAVWKGASDESLIYGHKELIGDQFSASIRQCPQLLPGVAEGLRRLRDAGALVLVLTEGARARATWIAAEHGIDGLFDRIIEAPKTVRLFKRVVLLTKAHVRAFMIGDQLLRDIAPAKEAGLITIYVPGRFRPRWEPEELKVGPGFRVDHFDQAVDLILRQE